MFGPTDYQLGVIRGFSVARHVQVLAAQGNKIEAVKEIRVASGLGLSESLDWYRMLAPEPEPEPANIADVTLDELRKRVPSMETREVIDTLRLLSEMEARQ